MALCYARLGQAALARSQVQLARDYCERAVAILKPANAADDCAIAELCLATVLLVQEEFDTARMILESTLVVVTGLDSLHTRGSVLYYLGDLHFCLAQYREAEAYYVRALSDRKRTRSLVLQGECHVKFGDISLATHDVGAAMASYVLAFVVFRRRKHVPGLAAVYRCFGVALLELDLRHQAQVCLEAARDLFRLMAATGEQADCLSRLGDLALRRADELTARTYYAEAVKVYQNTSLKKREQSCMDKLVKVVMSMDA
jgi:tetratricopeptide (TPR) repeat protein